MAFNLDANPTTEEIYNNVEAHKDIRAMMSRGERLAMFFAIDKYGYATVRIESKTTRRFTYQLNPNSFKWLVKYLMFGKAEDYEVDPSAPVKSSHANSYMFRRNMLIAFVKTNIGNFQTLPAVLDRPGKLTTTVTFKHGSILFFTERDDEIENFLRKHKLIS